MLIILTCLYYETNITDKYTYDGTFRYILDTISTKISLGGSYNDLDIHSIYIDYKLAFQKDSSGTVNQCVNECITGIREVKV